ncbi:methyl-accepting chemotaxis protein [Ponticaulis koreensis]|uniref:methyl-accepting chemotaxis protein n=1 Tax=Ponticaulis koreensis TaxID=1123045 RepID=UPI0003B3BCF7|nr:methyl-accepting chemotaxis protein [Ponticaulis koreensis]
MLNRISITYKLLGLVVGGIAVTAMTLGWVTSQASSEALSRLSEDKLSSIAQTEAAAFSDYLQSIQQDLDTVADNPFTLSALREFENGWDALGSNQMNTLQDLYIESNPNPLGEKHLLDYASDGSEYSQAHAEFHPWFRQFLEARGYYDIFLFSNDGSLVYTVFKELDYATNLRTGEWASSDLGAAFRAAADDSAYISDHAFFDFQPYAPSHGAPASFIARPIPDENGNQAGVLVFQMPIDQLNEIMGATSGLGETGESFLIGEDGLLRTDAPRSDTSTILNASFPTDSLAGAASRDFAMYEGASYTGADVSAAIVPVEFEGAQWFVVAQENTEELNQPIVDLQQRSLITSLIVLAVLGVIGAFFARMISGPIASIAKTTDKIANGYFDTVIPYQKRGDEIGPLARSLEKFRLAMISSEKLAKEQQERAIQDRKDAEQRAAIGEALTKRAQKFDEIVSRTLEQFTKAAGNLDENASAMAAIAEETASQSQGITAASQNASSNVQSVAAATEELTMSVNEISSKVEHSRDATSNAVSKAEVMRERVGGLETAANAISDVVGLITDIAGQTNLLALNATIEAARAGEAGKGFAVVASEVKALATQTSKATEDISRQVHAIQETTSASVSGIHDILTVISELEEASAQISAAIAQQNSATMQISESIQSAAGSVSEVDNNMHGVSDAAQEAGVTASRMRTASELLSEQSNILKSEVMSFLNDVRVA